MTEKGGKFISCVITDNTNLVTMYFVSIGVPFIVSFNTVAVLHNRLHPPGHAMTSWTQGHADNIKKTPCKI
jgi:hypothetical protein